MAARAKPGVPFWPRKEGRVRAASSGAVLFSVCFNQVGPVRWDPVGQGRMAQDWSLIRLLS